MNPALPKNIMVNKTWESGDMYRKGRAG